MLSNIPSHFLRCLQCICCLLLIPIGLFQIFPCVESLALKIREPSEPYTIRIAVKDSDGGDVVLLQPLKHDKEENKFVLNSEHDDNEKDHDTWMLEEVLQKEEGFEGLIYKPDEQGGGKNATITYTQTIEKGNFKRKEGTKESIWGLAMALHQFDSRWQAPGEKRVRGPTGHWFKPVFDGHAIVVLTKQQAKIENGEWVLKEKEVGRFHFNGKGLNFFDKVVHKKNFIINPFTMRNHAEEVPIKRNRGPYTLNGFRTELRSDSWTIDELTNIALNVIGDREWQIVDPPFTCLHFVYQFVMAIVDKNAFERLRDYEEWPSNLRNLSDLIDQKLDHYDAFNESIDYINRHIPKKQKVDGPNFGAADNEKTNRENTAILDKNNKNIFHHHIENENAKENGVEKISTNFDNENGNEKKIVDEKKKRKYDVLVSNGNNSTSKITNSGDHHENGNGKTVEEKKFEQIIKEAIIMSAGHGKGKMATAGGHQQQHQQHHQAIQHAAFQAHPNLLTIGGDAKHHMMVMAAGAA